LAFHSERPCDNSVAFQEKSSLLAYIGLYAAGELDFFDHFGNLYYAFGINDNVQSHAGLSGFQRN
jgi:hypothetical protein